LHDALTCPAEPIWLTNAEVDGDHCETMVRTLFHSRTLNWFGELPETRLRL
jgi:hypothetical protein